jgi:hypothetical protein
VSGANNVESVGTVGTTGTKWGSGPNGPNDFDIVGGGQATARGVRDKTRTLWDGKSNITVREATDTERTVLEAEREEAIINGVVENPDDAALPFEVRERNQ